jgi:hypothetical protein
VHFSKTNMYLDWLKLNYFYSTSKKPNKSNLFELSYYTFTMEYIPIKHLVVVELL